MNFDLALQDLLVVQKLQPNDGGVKKEIVILKKVTRKHNLLQLTRIILQAVQDYKNTEKKMYGKMFG